MENFSYGRIFVIGLGFFVISLAWSVYNAFMPLMLGEFIESKSLRGAIMGIDNFANLLLIPIIGAWSDRLNTPYGKRLPFLIVGMPIAAIALFLMPNYLNLWTLIAIDILFLLAMTLFRAPTVSLMPDVTPSEKRSQANGIINFMGGIGAIIAFTVMAKLYDLDKTYPFYIIGVIMLIVIVTLYFSLRKIVPNTGQFEPEETEERPVGIIQGLTEIFRNRNRTSMLVFWAIFFWFVAYSGVDAQFTTYGTETLGLTGGNATMLLAFFSVSFIIFAIPSGFLVKLWGRKRTIQIGIIILMVIFGGIFFTTNIWVIRALLLIGGAGWAFINIHSYPMVVDMTIEARIGLFTGIYYLFSSLSQMIGPTILGIFMDTLGNQYMYLGALFFLLIALILISMIKEEQKVERKVVN